MKKIIAVLMVFLLAGCFAKTTTETIADEAKETISGVIKALPKECQTDMTKVALNGAIAQVESVKEYCVAREQILNEKIRYRNLIILVLSALVLGLVFRKLRQSLFR